MKKIFFILLIGIIVVHAQWKPVYVGTSRSLYSVQFYDTAIGIIAGANGFIARTADGGKNWVPNLDYINAYPDFYSVCLTNASGWIGGRFGALLKSTNMGLSWNIQSGFSSQVGGFWLSQIIFINDTVGWMCGGYNAVFRTKFGDGFWTTEYLTKGPEQFGYLFTKDCITGYFVGINGNALKTIDRGITSSSLQTGVTTKLENVTFVNDSVGWIVGAEGTILKTTNAGKNWSKYQSNPEYHFNWVTFATDSIGWIVGGNGIILKTTNAGSSWDPVPSGTTATLRAVYFKDKNFGCIVGDSGKVLIYDPSFVLQANEGQAENIETAFTVEQNYPNPFNPKTTINFTIPETGNVELKIFDVLGKEIQTLINQTYIAGQHTVQFDSRGLSSGTYIYRLRSGKYISSQKMILAK